MRTSEVFEALIRAKAPDAKWGVFTNGLAAIGLDQINYAFLDSATYGRIEAWGDPARSTTRADWLRRYSERQYNPDGVIVSGVRAGLFRSTLPPVQLSRSIRPAGHQRRGARHGELN
jgi:hypothetical protein